MKTRPYPGRDGRRVWLSRSEQRTLLESVIDEPRRRLAIQLGLHGLRSDEIVSTDNSRGVSLDDFAELDDGSGWVLEISDGKTGTRETPASEDLAERARMLKSAARLRKNEPLVDVSTRTLRSWIEDAREEISSEADNPKADRWSSVGFHDLRRTWATDTYYALAFDGVPIAEELVLSWGGWAHTSTGRETFRTNYLGPVPDHVTSSALDSVELI